MQRELSLIEAHARRLLDLIEEGKGNALSMKELDKLSDRQEALVRALKRLDDLAQVADVDANASPRTSEAAWKTSPPYSLVTCHRPVRCLESSWMGTLCVNRLPGWEIAGFIRRRQ